MLVSVIVPVYNAAQFLEECIQSILKQDFEDFEILLINDGSTDNSGKICNHYATIDERVKVFHKENGGVSSARNVGIEKAKGKWITFIDSDDYIENHYFNSLKNVNNSDWILLEFKKESLNKTINNLGFKNEQFIKENFISKYSIYPHFPSPCGSFYRKEIITKHKISFNPSLIYGEDFVFNIRYLNYCKLISTTNLSAYFYRYTSDGLSKTKYNNEMDFLFYKEMKNGLEKFDNKDFYNRCIIIPLTRFIKSLYGAKQFSPQIRKKLLKEIVENNYPLILKIFTSNKIKPFIVIAHYLGLYSMLDYLLFRLNK